MGLQRPRGHGSVARIGTERIQQQQREQRVEPEPPAQAERSGGLTREQVLRLQAGAGNRAVAGMLGGKKLGMDPKATEQQMLGGRTAGEAAGDVYRPVRTGIGNVVGDIMGAATGISISATSLVGPTWNDNGHFDWGVSFTTSGRSGWIVQEIINGYRAEDADGAALPTDVVPHYWEAWPVDDAGKVTPIDGRGNDDWIRPDRGDDTQGHWSMRGKVFWTETDPATQGFTAGGVSNAGDLLSTTSEPSDLGIARLHRYAQGTWDSTGFLPTHEGSAS